MSDNEKNVDENGQDEGSINVFDDNAYMFGDDPSGNNLEEQNEINDENPINQKEIENNDKEEYDNNENEEINNMESKDSLRKYLEQQMKHDQIQNNDNNINVNQNSIKNKLSTNEENISKKIQNSKDENEINVTKKSEKNMQNMQDIQKELLNNNQNEEFEGEEQEQENYPGEEEEVENGELEDIEGEVENEAEGEGEGEEEENIPLVTLKFISICQFCKNNFNSTVHLPYLLKCGHFFCLKCIKENFTDEEGIKCPNDGLVALSVKELKLLNNLITDKSIPSQRDIKDNLENNENININGIDNISKTDLKNTCKIHKGQKLTHIITETKQLVCVYCAFDVVRKNPKCEVKEIKEKFDELVLDAEKIINLNQNNIKIIQDSLKDIKKNKETEEKNVNLYFDHIFKYLNSKKGEYLSQIDSFFTDNVKKLNQKLENFSEQIEQGESLKALIDNYENNNNFDEIMDTYIKLENIKKSEKENSQVNLQEYKFSHDDETKIMKYINNFGDIKTVNKFIHFQNEKKDIFNLKVSSNVAPIVEEQKKNFFNFNTNPALITNSTNNKNSARLTNNSLENQEMENEMNYNNNSNISNHTNNKKHNNFNNNYNFNFNKINPMSNNSTGKRNIKTNFGNNNLMRYTMNNSNELNNGNMNYINMDSNPRDNKNYSFNNLSSTNKNRGHRLISLQDNNFISNKGSTGEGKVLNNNNIYNINYPKRIGVEKINNSNLNKNMNNKNIRNEFGNHTQGPLGTYEYKGFKTFNFK